MVGYYIKDGKLTKQKAVEGYTSTDTLTTFSFVGKQIAYFHNGSIKKTSHYNKKSELDGMTTQYFTNGQVHQTVHYTNNVIDGKVTTFHKNGQLENEEFYILGKHKDGICKHFDAHGKLSRIHTYKNGTYDGEYIDYYSNGNKKTVATYANGRVLKRTKYYTDGKVQSTYVKKNGESLSEHFNEQGVKTKRVLEIYKKNRSHMAERELWYDNGQPRTTEYYDPGNVKNGTFNAWFKHGQLRKQNVFKHGVPVSEKSWTMEGKPVIEKTYQQGKLNGKTKRWDDRTGQ